MTPVETPQSHCRAGVARCDITPPVGIYHRMWGAATHDRATGIHRPLLATLLWLAPAEGDAQDGLLIAAIDHCLLDDADIERLQRAMAASTGIRAEQVQVACSHTHAAGLMSRSRSHLPGGELIGPYLDDLAARCAKAATEAVQNADLANIAYAAGRCGLAKHRDFWDEASGQYVCGFNPAGPADDTLLVAHVTTFPLQGGFRRIATLVNYACHPTTLAWQNTLISPDYVGAMREWVERHMDGYCLFLQGASGDLGPRDGFVGYTDAADHNGRQLGLAALATLATLPPPITRFVYAGPVVSGATIGTWQHQPLDPDAMRRISTWRRDRIAVELPYRDGLPTREVTEQAIAHWQATEHAARRAGNDDEARDAHARVEQMTRQLWRQSALPPGKAFPLRITLARLGDAIWLFVPGEHYQVLQTTLRARFPERPIIVTAIAGGWQPGYIPPAETYGKGIYQEQVAVVAAGSAEAVIKAAGDAIERILNGR